MMEDITINGKHAFVFKPQPPYDFFIGNTLYYCNTLDDIRNSKIDEDIKEKMIEVFENAKTK